MAVAFSAQTGDYRDDNSSMGRIEAWVAGMSMLQQHPLVGVGKGQFLEHYSRDSHNSFVRAGAELGFIGLYAFVGVVYYGILFLVGTKRRFVVSNDFDVYRTGYLGFFAAYLVGSIFSTRTYDIVFLVAVALTGALQRLSIGKNKVSEGPGEALFIKKLWNNYVFTITLGIIAAWKLFLVQVW